MARMRFVLMGILLIVVSYASPVCDAATVVFQCPHDNPSGPLMTGVRELERVFIKQGWIVRRAFGTASRNEKNADLKISVMPFEAVADTPAEAEKFKNVVSNRPESFSIVKSNDGGTLHLIALGSDDRGAMYAAYELAEQIERTVAIPMAQRVMEVKQAPSIPNRGIQLLLHKQALDDPFSWFHSEKFWEGFVETLVRNRFNYLELQGVYDLITTQFSNLLPYFYVGSGLDVKDIERNVKSLQRILDLAVERGLTVYLVNSGLDWGGNKSTEIERASLEKTTASAVARLLEICPQLDGLGLMVDDSNMPAEFYQAAYLKALQESGRQAAFLLHTWAADPKQVDRLVEDQSARIVLELKFNGDHLGLPYPVTGGRMKEWSSYSYQDYFQHSGRFGLLFQIPFNGTHRIFPWGDAAFIRRTLASTVQLGASGFVLQTFSTYSPHADAYTNPIRSDLRYFDWTYQRDWYWYLLWGRLAYDLDLPNLYFERKFQERFGEGAGSDMFRALQQASKVVPAIAATCFRGPGMRDFAPEFEPPMHLEDMDRLLPLDSFSIRSVSEEIERLVSGNRDGRRSPIDLLNVAAHAAIESVTLSQTAGRSIQDSLASNDVAASSADQNVLKEWNSWAIDFQALAALGRYWRDRIGAAVQVGIYMKTGDIPSLVIASERLNGAHEAWTELQDRTSLHYRPLLDTLRNGQTRFHWKLQSTFVDEDRLWITQLYNAWLNQAEWLSVSGHFPLSKIPTTSPALLTLSIPPKIAVDSMFVQYQNQQGEMARFPLGAAQLDGVYYAEITPGVLKEGVFQYFFIGKLRDTDEAWAIPREGPIFSIAVTDDDRPPFLSPMEELVSQSSGRAFVSAKLTDAAGVDAAYLWWKRFPSGAQWVKTSMEGNGEIFQGMIPVSDEGAQYAIEAVDFLGNVSRFPDMTQETPYRIIRPNSN